MKSQVLSVLLVNFLVNNCDCFGISAEPNLTGCNRTIDVGDVIQSPAIAVANKGKPYNCWFLLRPRGSTLNKDSSTIILLRFLRFQWGQLANGTTCQGGYLKIYDGSTALHDSGSPGVYCGEIERSRTFISESSVVKLHFVADRFDERFQFVVHTHQEQQQQLVQRYGHHPALYHNRRGQPISPGSLSCDREFVDCRIQTCFVQSPNYPGIYPRNLRCLYHISTRQPYIKLFTEDGEFSVDGQRCDNYIMCPLRPVGQGDCPHDYIRIYDGNSESSPVIGTFCGTGRFPFSIVGTGTDLLLEFVSSPAGPLLNTGFHFNVDSWPGQLGSAFTPQIHQQPVYNNNTSDNLKTNSNCKLVLTSTALEISGESEGLFLSPMHWYPPKTVCNYLIVGKPEQIVRMYFPTFRISRPDAPIRDAVADCSESLTIYDGDKPDPSTIVKTFCDTFSKPMERRDFVSTGPALFLQFNSEIGSYSGSSLYFWAHYDFFNNSQSEGRRVPGSECDVVYDAKKRVNGLWTSPYNTLLYKRNLENSTLSCRYRFKGDKRNSSRVLLTITDLNLKTSTKSCADRLTFRDIDNDLTVLNLNISRFNIDAGNLKGKLYVCPIDKVFLPIKVISSGAFLSGVLEVDGHQSTALYFKSSSLLFQGRYDFIHPPGICGSVQPDLTSNGFFTIPWNYNEDDEEITSLTCMWDFVIANKSTGSGAKSSESKENAALWLQIEESHKLNLVPVTDSKSCGKTLPGSGNFVEVSVPGKEKPVLLLCEKENATIGVKQPSPTDGTGHIRDLPANNHLVPLKSSELGFSKAVVTLHLARPGKGFAMRVSWTGIH